MCIEGFDLNRRTIRLRKQCDTAVSDGAIDVHQHHLDFCGPFLQSGRSFWRPGHIVLQRQNLFIFKRQGRKKCSREVPPGYLALDLTLPSRKFLYTATLISAIAANTTPACSLYVSRRVVYIASSIREDRMSDEQLDPRVDAYIERAAPFAQPVLTHLRKLMHQACPRATE